MTAKEFALALATTRMSPQSATAKAARLCLVDGQTAYAAARQIGIHESAVSRARNRLQAILDQGICPTCGQARR